MNALERFFRERAGDLPLLDTFAQNRIDGRARRIERAAVGVVQDRVVAGDGGEVRDAATHRSRSDDGNRPNHRARSLSREPVYRFCVMSFFREFKEFALKGSVVDLAVGVILGAAFSTVVKSFTEDILMPPITRLSGQRDLSNHFIA